MTNDQPQAADATNRSQQQESDSQPRKFWWSRHYEGVMLISQFLTFAAIIAYTVFSCRQSQAMFEANKIALQNTQAVLAQSKALADGAITASRNQANASLAESKRQSEAALKQAQDNAASEQRLTRDGLAESRAALTVARQQMKESLRAKVFVEVINIDFEKATHPISGTFRNSGALPAEWFEWGMAWVFGAIQAPSVDMTRYSNPLLPNGQHPFGATVELSAERVDLIKKGAVPFLVWIKFKYGDRLSRTYPPEIECFKYSAEYKALVYCETAGVGPQAPK